MNPQSHERRIRRLISYLCLSAFICSSRLAAHPPDLVPEPATVPEAWNVVRQSTANIESLLDTNQLKEITLHVSNISPALRTLQANLKDLPNAGALHDHIESLYTSGSNLILATREKDKPLDKARIVYDRYKKSIDALAGHYPPAATTAQVYICPMHPRDRHLHEKAVCTLCKMKLIRRRISASTVYEKPGQPSIKMTATPAAALRLNQKADITIQLVTAKDNAPVARADLHVMHTQKIHLLIVDPTLTDYHHEHPTPTDRPGEYAFSFTPRKPGPYRIFADLVPSSTSLQEYVIADIVTEDPPAPVAKSDTTLTTRSADLTFTIALANNHSLRSSTPVPASLTINRLDGKPFTQLEPIMGAFAHLVAFHEDRQTVLHIHPEGTEPDRPDRRGGPSLPFTLYAPKPGFYKLYAQVQINGQSLFAPFSLNIPAPREGEESRTQAPAGPSR